MSQSRKARLIRESIDSLMLDLSGLTVFTEAATGNFAVTAPIAAAAGADTVYAIGRDSSYGSKGDAFVATEQVAKDLNVQESINFIDKKAPQALAEADIVTNTGFVRPINDSLVVAMKGSGAVSLMYEPWEYRGDVAVEACWDSNIPVVGTDESDPRVRTQEYVGLLPVQLSLSHDIEVLNSRYLVVGGGDMARYTTEKLRKLGGSVTRVEPEKSANNRSSEILSSLDAIVIVDHRTDKILLGDDGIVSIKEVEKHSPDVSVFHICGPVDSGQLGASSIEVIPDSPAEKGHMSFTAGAVGPRPVIELHTAGLAVGAVAARKQASGYDFQTAVDAAVSESVGADFDETFKRAHGHPDYVS